MQLNRSNPEIYDTENRPFNFSSVSRWLRMRSRSRGFPRRFEGAMLCYVVCCVILCHVLCCKYKLCYVVSCRAMCFVVSCYVVSMRHVVSIRNVVCMCYVVSMRHML